MTAPHRNWLAIGLAFVIGVGVGFASASRGPRTDTNSVAADARNETLEALRKLTMSPYAQGKAVSFLLEVPNVNRDGLNEEARFHVEQSVERLWQADRREPLRGSNISRIFEELRFTTKLAIVPAASRTHLRVQWDASKSETDLTLNIEADMKAGTIEWAGFNASDGRWSSK